MKSLARQLLVGAYRRTAGAALRGLRHSIALVGLRGEVGDVLTCAHRQAIPISGPSSLVSSVLKPGYDPAQDGEPPIRPDKIPGDILEPRSIHPGEVHPPLRCVSARGLDADQRRGHCYHANKIKTLDSRVPRLRGRPSCKKPLQILQLLQLLQLEASMTEAVTKLRVEETDRDQAKKGASFLERASLLEHGGLFLTKADGERVMAEMPASLLRAMQSLLAAMAEGPAFVFKPDDEVSPEKAAELLGVSRPIVYQRMDTGKLAFRQVGTHRRIRAADVAELKQSEDRRRSFAAALSADTEDLEENYAQPGKSAS